MWIKTQDGKFYRREAFLRFDIERVKYANDPEKFLLRGTLGPAVGGDSMFPASAPTETLGEYSTLEDAQEALNRIFPDAADVADLGGA